MPLARLMVLIALQTLLAATTGFEIDGPLEGARMPEIGYVSVPLRITGAAR
jgi:hypothetical protein